MFGNKCNCLMMTWIMRQETIQLLTLSLLIRFKCVVSVYEIGKCPSPWQWKLRAQSFCSMSHARYSCLFDIIQQQYKESCSAKPDFVKPGKRYVIRGERDNDNCIASRYQPFKLWSNESSECEYIKNECNEIGQVIARNGSTTEDSSCRCDYTKGFDFVVKPKNACYCFPVAEDCSCIKNKCSAGKILTTDYSCVSKENFEGQDSTCSLIVETREPSFIYSSVSRQDQSRPTHLRDPIMNLLLSVLLSVVLSICIIFSAILLFYSNCTEMLTAYGCPAYDTIDDYADGVFNGNADADGSLHSGHISITICEGQIADQKVDAIVNSTKADLNLNNGAVSQSLLNAAGESLQQECKQNYPNGIEIGKIAVTGGGRLDCINVYHGTLPVWSKEAHKTFDMLMEECLLEAKKSNFKSIAFPALGTGNLNYPKSEVARMMFANVKKFERDFPMSSITDVRFVCYDEDTLKAFEHELKKEKIDFKTATVSVYQGDILKICVQGMVKLRKANEMENEKVKLKAASSNCASEFTIDLNFEDQSSDLKSKIKLVFLELFEIHQHSVVFPVNELGNMQEVCAAFVNVFQNWKATDNTFDVHLVVNEGNMVQTFVNCLKNAMTSEQIQ